MASGGIKIDARTGEKLFPADKIFTISNGKFGKDKKTLYFGKKSFTCAATGTKLTLKNYVVFEDEIYLKGKQPDAKHKQVTSIEDERIAAVPDSGFTQTARQFNIAGKGDAKGATGHTDAGSSYGAGAVAITTQTSVPEQSMSTSHNAFVIAGNAGKKASTQEMPGSRYGLDGTVLSTQTTVVKPAAVGIANVDRKQVRHNGVDRYTGTDGNAVDATAGP